MPYSAEVYEQLRRATGELDDDSEYTDSKLDLYLDAHTGDVNLAASDIWRDKASQFAELVDISEAGSSRKNSSLYEHAIAQMDLYGESASGSAGGEPGVDFTTVGKIVRE